jgi:four helix bundle protein
MKINDYRDLEVWQLGRTLVKEIYLLTKTFPPEERYGLTSQMRRAAVSIPSNTAEGWGRHYTAEFIQFLRKANGSRTELETQLILSQDLEMATPQQVEPLLQQANSIGRKLLNLERSLQTRMAKSE